MKKADKIIFEDTKSIISKINHNKFKNKKILITGANGLFGQYFVSLFLNLNKQFNYNIKIYTINKSGPNKFLRNNLPINSNLKIDLSKNFNFPKKVNFIFHCAGYARPKKWASDKIGTIKLNVNGTENLLGLAKKNKAKFMFFSSLDVYGQVPLRKLPVKEVYKGYIDSSDYKNSYGEAKRLGENICSVYREEKKVKAYVVRIFHTYGPGIKMKDERVIADIIRSAYLKKKINLKDSGKSIKHFCYILDAVLMMTNIITNGKSFVYNIAGNQVCSIKELSYIIGKEFNLKKKDIKVKNKKELYIKNFNDKIYASVKKYENEFGKIEYQDFITGMRKIIQWMKYDLIE